jgi:hypothetical protein
MTKPKIPPLSQGRFMNYPLLQPVTWGSDTDTEFIRNLCRARILDWKSIVAGTCPRRDL